MTPKEKFDAYLNALLITTLIVGIVAVLLMGFFVTTSFATDDTIRPTDLCDTTSFFDAGTGNAWDNSLSSYTYNTGKLNNFDIHFGETGACTAIDSWETLAYAGTYDSATIYAKYSKTACTDDKATVYFANSADVKQQTMYTDVVGAITLTTSSWDVTSTYLADLTDLRFGFEIAKSGGGDTCEFRVYEVWIDGVYYDTGGRSRIFNIGKKEKENEKSNGSVSDVGYGGREWWSVRRYDAILDNHPAHN